VTKEPSKDVSDVDHEKDYIKKLEQKVEQLTKENNKLKTEVKDLTVEVKDLTSLLRKNSENSSKPPSSDGLRKKPVIPGSQRIRTGKSQGGQKGHKGSTLVLLSEPTRFTHHKARACGCGFDLCASKVRHTVQTDVVDIEAGAGVVTRHTREVKRCPSCKKNVTAKLPEGIAGRSSSEYGPKIKGLAAYLAVEHFIPGRRTAGILKAVFGIGISTGSIARWLTEASRALAGFEEAVKKELIKSPALNADETGARCAGSLSWIHSASTARLTLFEVHKSRGFDAMSEMGILPKFRGVVVHDHFKAYFRFTECVHALCNAHILRELKFLEEGGAVWAKRMSTLLVAMSHCVRSAKEAGSVEISRSLKKRFLKRYRKYLKSGLKYHRENDPVFTAGARGRVKQSKGKNLLDRLSKFRDEVLRFMNDFAVPFTNNQAEQDIRMNKVKLKISGCFRSILGAKEFCRIRSYLSTMRKQHRPILEAICAVFTNRPFEIEQFAAAA
jgi:transposase